MANVLIIGAGWLGTPLAEVLLGQGHKVTATRRSQSRLDEYRTSGIYPALLNLADSDCKKQLSSLIKKHNIERIIGTFPPGFRKGNGDEYAKQWHKVIDVAKKEQIQKVVMVSSTTVYPNVAADMKEEDATLSLAKDNPNFSSNAQIILQAEQYIIHSNVEFAILRCSGLIGADRHPSRFTNRLKQVSSQAPANMLHQQDAAYVTAFALSQIKNQIVNVTTPNTVSKAEFYQAAIEKSGLNLSLPPITHTPDKRIVADKLIALGYQFMFKSTLDAI
ncbi:NAD(P)H-binding protein [Vibrio sagamiensis]|uniref:Nucleoside-diphosphate sugar epimerase n=1 Tax=Vibrio sagamiensis NBRC 104589 TaxID=1219064 RepID=A0A511QI68_9VIBR|nr:NAD(P)H-binding protein [Vibrio sagamiensis]PNQ63302.1 NAD(P)-dependent oxidoreductase [Vibrio agarivorans]GEM76981.1 nucleoside-diphosphate sugar epimerase [Vibrio sagamiensis NBRC 104589]